MKIKNEKLDLQKVDIPVLEKDSEGKLRGGFSAVNAKSNDSDGWSVKLLCNCICSKPGEDGETPTPPTDDTNPPTPPTDGNEPPTDAFGNVVGSSLIF